MTTDQIVELVKDRKECLGTINKCNHDILKMTNKVIAVDSEITTLISNKEDLKYKLEIMDQEIQTLKSIASALKTESSEINDIQLKHMRLESKKFDVEFKLQSDEYELMAYNFYQLNALAKQREDAEDFVKKLNRTLKRLEKQSFSSEKNPVKKTKTKKAA